MANDLPAKYNGIRDLQTKFLIRDMHADYYLVKYLFQFRKEKKVKVLQTKYLAEGYLAPILKTQDLEPKSSK